MATTKDGIEQSRMRETVKWGGTVLCVLLASLFVTCVLWESLTVSVWGFSEIGFRRCAFVALSQDELPPAAIEDEEEVFHSAAEGMYGPPYYSIDQWLDDWIFDLAQWPSWGEEDGMHWTIVPLWFPFAIVFPVTVWLWRDERKWMIVALVAVVVSMAVTRVLARYYYMYYWPGHPDSIRYGIGMLPAGSLYFCSDYFWQDAEQARIFLSACSYYVIPPLIGMALTKQRWGRFLILVICILSVREAVKDSWELASDYLRQFCPEDYSLGNVIDWVWGDVKWVLGLTLGGLFAGWLIRWGVERYRPSRGCCRVCGYDLRVQSALGIDRCPECGKEIKSSNPERESSAS